MYKLMYYLIENRKKIIITVAIIVFAFIVIRVIDTIIANQKEDMNNTSIITEDEKRLNKSIITGDRISKETTDENLSYIKEFVEYCNNNEYENAYLLLSDDCKEEYNNNVNEFEEKFCKEVFSTKKIYNLELWIKEKESYTYKIDYYDDNFLASGGNNLNSSIEDYITINKDKKLSINEFIKRENINKTQIVDGIEIIVNSKKTYIDYEQYNITIKNNTNTNILISEGNEGKEITITDRNDVEYNSLINDISDKDLSLQSGYEKNINIKFTKMYDTHRVIKSIEFNDIILDYENKEEDQEKILKIMLEL